MTSPLSGERNPAIIRSVVVLPQPEGPSKVTNSPSCISRLTSFSIGWSSKLIEMFLRSIITALFSNYAAPFQPIDIVGKYKSMHSLIGMR